MNYSQSYKRCSEGGVVWYKGIAHVIEYTTAGGSVRPLEGIADIRQLNTKTVSCVSVHDIHMDQEDSTVIPTGMTEKDVNALRGNLTFEEYQDNGMSLFKLGLVSFDPLAGESNAYPLTALGEDVARRLRTEY